MGTNVYINNPGHMTKADLKKLLVCCAPCYPQKLALPKKFYGHAGENIFFFFIKKPKIKDSVYGKYLNQNFQISFQTMCEQ